MIICIHFKKKLMKVTNTTWEENKIYNQLHPDNKKRKKRIIQQLCHKKSYFI